MPNPFKLIALYPLLALLAACATTSHDGPSPEARGMAGAEERFDFRPVDWQEGDETWWNPIRVLA